MTANIPDAADYDIESLMMELDAQTLEMTATTEAKVEVNEIDESLLDEIDQAITESAQGVIVEPNEEELELAAAIALAAAAEEDIQAALSPTAANTLDAEQELDLAEVFEAPVATPSPIDDQAIVDEMLEQISDSIQVEPDKVVATEPDKAVELEDETVAIEPTESVELQQNDIPGFEPKPASTPERTEKALAALTKMKYAPDIEAFNREIAFSDATLDDAMMTQASLVAYQVERSARAAAQAASLKLKFDSIEAMLYEAYRKDFIAKGEKSTEKTIENAVRKDSRWRKAKEAVIEAEMYADIHKGFVFALKDRNDMLIQRGSYRRAEMQGQVRTMDTANESLKQSSGHAAAMAAMRQAKKA